MHARDIDRVVSEYVAAWNVSDGVARQRHLHAAWNEAGRFEDPLVSLAGRRAMDEYIASFKGDHAGVRMLVTGPVDHHHDWFHLGWTLVDRCGTEVLAGCSVGTLDEQGRILHLAAFFGRPVLGPCDALAAVALFRAGSSSTAAS